MSQYDHAAPTCEASHSGPIANVLTPKEKDLGEMTVRRALPAQERQMVGPFIFFDRMGPAHFGPQQGIDVRPHPHINLATLTYLFDGAIHHRDSLGNDLVIEPGAVNWMRAGRGIVHSERTPNALRDQTKSLSGIQVWVALPTAEEESDPDFIHLPKSALPQLTGDGYSGRVVAGAFAMQRSPLAVASPTLLVDLRLETGATVHSGAAYREQAVFVAKGEVTVAGQTFAAHQMIVLRPGADAPITARRPARVIVFGGEPLDGPRFIWWNFVSSRRHRIDQAKADWSAGHFTKVPGDDAEFIPLPEDRGMPIAAVGDPAHYRS